MVWIKFIGSQVVMGIAAVLGLLILPVPCLLQVWSDSARSIKDNRVIDEWRWSWLNYVYGNPEDGVSGKYARIWSSDGTLGPYLPTQTTWLRAYRWSALRNSCDNLKYLLATGPMPRTGQFGATGGPIKYWWKFKFGYQLENGYNVPVMGLK